MLCILAPYETSNGYPPEQLVAEAPQILSPNMQSL